MTDYATQREIAEGCTVIADRLGDPPAIEAARPDRVTLVGCGSSYWTGVLGAALFREAGVDATAVQSSEFLAAPPPLSDRTVVAYSQSGETTETVAALRRAGEGGARTVAVTNDTDSTLADASDLALAVGAGHEEAILATKSVDGALAVTYALVARLCDTDLPDATGAADACRAVLETDMEPIVRGFVEADRAYVLGQAAGYGVAGEAATKIVEGGLVHATPLPALEITHGPMANVADVPVLVFVRAGEDTATYRELFEQLSAADARLLVVTTGDAEFPAAEAVVHLADGPTCLPLVKAAQRIAYGLAVAKGLDPDSPPQLSKHVEWTHLD